MFYGIDRCLLDLTNRHRPVVVEGSSGSESNQFRAPGNVRHPMRYREANLQMGVNIRKKYKKPAVCIEV